MPLMVRVLADVRAPCPSWRPTRRTPRMNRPGRPPAAFTRWLSGSSSGAGWHMPTSSRSRRATCVPLRNSRENRWYEVSDLPVPSDPTIHRLGVGSAVCDMRGISIRSHRRRGTDTGSMPSVGTAKTAPGGRGLVRISGSDHHAGADLPHSVRVSARGSAAIRAILPADREALRCRLACGSGAE